MLINNLVKEKKKNNLKNNNQYILKYIDFLKYKKKNPLFLRKII